MDLIESEKVPCTDKYWEDFVEEQGYTVDLYIDAVKVCSTSSGDDKMVVLYNYQITDPHGDMMYWDDFYSDVYESLQERFNQMLKGLEITKYREYYTDSDLYFVDENDLI